MGSTSVIRIEYATSDPAAEPLSRAEEIGLGLGARALPRPEGARAPRAGHHLVVDHDRAACARFGLNTGDVDQVVEAAIGGQALTQVYEGEKHFDLTVRWLKPYRESLEAVREITVPTPAGQVVPLGQIAKINLEEGPSVIFREDGKRYVPVKFSVRGRDLASTIACRAARTAWLSPSIPKWI